MSGMSINMQCEAVILLTIFTVLSVHVGRFVGLKTYLGYVQRAMHNAELYLFSYTAFLLIFVLKFISPVFCRAPGGSKTLAGTEKCILDYLMNRHFVTIKMF